MAVPLETNITRTGLQQSDLVKFLENVRDLVNEMRTDYTALLAKLDADVGVTDTNYAATLPIAATAVTLNKG